MCVFYIRMLYPVYIMTHIFYFETDMFSAETSTPNDSDSAQNASSESGTTSPGPLSVNSKRNRMALIKLETVFFTYLWSLDLEVVLTSMSCFRLLCEEADLWSEAIASTFALSMPAFKGLRCECCFSVLAHATTGAIVNQRTNLSRLIETCTSSVATLPAVSLNPTPGETFDVSTARQQVAAALPCSEVEQLNRASSTAGSCIALCNCGCPLCVPASSHARLCLTGNATPATSSSSTADSAATFTCPDGEPSAGRASIAATAATTSSNGLGHNGKQPVFRSVVVCPVLTQLTLLDRRLPDILPVYALYSEVAEHSGSILTTGRAHLQKQILSLLRKINHQTQGNKLVSSIDFSHAAR